MKLRFPLYCFMGFCSLAQPLKIIWQNCYGGSGDDDGFSVLPSSTGYYLFGGTTSNDPPFIGFLQKEVGSKTGVNRFTVR